MAFNLQGGFGAGAGADMLETVLRRKLLEQQETSRIAQDAERNRVMDTRYQGDQDIQRGELKLREQEYQDRKNAPAPQPPAPKPISLAPGARLVDPTTGKVLFDPPAAAPAPVRPMAVAPGGRLVDPATGKELFHAPERPAAGPSQAATAKATAATQKASAAEVQQENEAHDGLALIDQISKDPALNASVGPLDQYGLGKVQDINGVNRFTALHNQLVGKMQLAIAGKLKGQGQISDKERAMLQSAASALTRGLSEDDYRAELQKVRGQFERMSNPGAAPTGHTGGTIFARDPQGNLHQAPAGTALPAGWKQEG